MTSIKCSKLFRQPFSQPFGDDRKRARLSRAICLSVFLSLFSAAFGASAFASLGGDANSVQADQTHLQGSLTTTSAANYTRHEIQTPNGTVVHEFVSSSGKVFGVAWKGQFLPDLRQLLGSNFDAYQQAAKMQKTHAHGPIIIRQSGLVVELGGHMRSHIGHAYLPSEMPSGVRAEDIQ